MKQIKWILVAGFLALINAGCGYHFSDGGSLQEGISRVAVTVFENKTAEPGVGTRFANELIREIMTRTDTRVVSPDSCDGRVSGTVKSITFSTLSRSSAEEVMEREVVAVLDVKLTDTDGKTLWSVKDFRATETYNTADDTVDDEYNKQKAIDTIASRASERLVNLMSSRF